MIEYVELTCCGCRICPCHLTGDQTVCPLCDKVVLCNNKWSDMFRLVIPSADMMCAASEKTEKYDVTMNIMAAKVCYAAPKWPLKCPRYADSEDVSSAFGRLQVLRMLHMRFFRNACRITWSFTRKGQKTDGRESATAQDNIYDAFSSSRYELSSSCIQQVNNCLIQWAAARNLRDRVPPAAQQTEAGPAEEPSPSTRKRRISSRHIDLASMKVFRVIRDWLWYVTCISESNHRMRCRQWKHTFVRTASTLRFQQRFMKGFVITRYVHCNCIISSVTAISISVGNVSTLRCCD